MPSNIQQFIEAVKNVKIGSSDGSGGTSKWTDEREVAGKN